MGKKKLVVGTIIVSIMFSIAAIALTTSSSYALFTNKQTSMKKSNYNTGLLSITAISKSNTISLANTLPMSDEEGLIAEPYIFTIKNNGNIDYKFDIRLLSTSSNSFSANYIKLKVDNDPVTTLGSLTKGIIKNEIVLEAGKTMDISLRVWLDSNTPNSEIGKSFTSQLVIDGVAVSTSTNYSDTAAAYITNTYNSSPKITVENNGIAYNYGTAVGLMNDRLGGITKDLNAGNIRYYGANPNNYIYFNCNDYSYGNNSKDPNNCEVWRIIGVFDNMIKIINTTSIGNYAWDTVNSNNWVNSSLMRHLNEGEYWQNTIKNKQTRNMIAEVTWNLGSSALPETDYSNEYYISERENSNYAGATSWTGKIGLMYPSDYGYATDFSSCSNSLHNYGQTSTCYTNDWLYENNTTFTMSANSLENTFIYSIIENGNVSYDGNNTTSEATIKPVVYLNSELSIYSGNGTLDSPYMIR